MGAGSIKTFMAFAVAGAELPPDTSWSYIAKGYFHQLKYTIRETLEYPTQHGTLGLLLYPMLAVGAVFLVLSLVRARDAGDGAFRALARGVTIGGVILLLLANNPQGYRYELVFLPAAAIGLAGVLSGRGTFRRLERPGAPAAV